MNLSPTWAKGYSRKASVFLRLKKYKDCIETCKIGKYRIPSLSFKALSLEPTNEAVIHILEVVDKLTSADVPSISPCSLSRKVRTFQPSKKRKPCRTTIRRSKAVSADFVPSVKTRNWKSSIPRSTRTSSQ